MAIPTMVTGDLAFGADVQVSLLVHLAHSPELMEAATEPPIDLTIHDFDLSACKVVYEALSTYWNKYNALPPPGVLVREALIVANNGRGDSQCEPLLREEYESLEYVMGRILAPGQLAVAYHRDELRRYVKNVRTQRLSLDAAYGLQQGIGTDAFVDQIAALKDLDAGDNIIPITNIGREPHLKVGKQATLITIPTGMTVLDRVLYGGLAFGETGIVVAGTGVGKTNTLINFAKNAARAGWHVLYINTELPGPLIEERLHAMAAHIPAHLLHLDVLEWPADAQWRLGAFLNSQYSQRIDLADLSKISNKTLAVIERTIKQWMRSMDKQGTRDKARLVILDWIGQVRPDRRYAGNEGDMSWKAMGGLMEEYTCMIRRWEVASWTASQGNREADGVQVVHQRHVALGLSLLFTVDVALGIAPEEKDRLMIMEVTDDNIAALKDGKPCDRLLNYSTMKNRKNPPMAFPLYQGPTLALWDTKDAMQFVEKRIKAGDLTAILPVESPQ